MWGYSTLKPIRNHLLILTWQHTTQKNHDSLTTQLVQCNIQHTKHKVARFFMRSWICVDSIDRVYRWDNFTYVYSFRCTLPLVFVLSVYILLYCCAGRRTTCQWYFHFQNLQNSTLHATRRVSFRRKTPTSFLAPLITVHTTETREEWFYKTTVAFTLHEKQPTHKTL